VCYNWLNTGGNNDSVSDSLSPCGTGRTLGVMSNCGARHCAKEVLLFPFCAWESTFLRIYANRQTVEMDHCDSVREVFSCMEGGGYTAQGVFMAMCVYFSGALLLLLNSVA
jgi:hypothetical protein